MNVAEANRTIKRAVPIKTLKRRDYRTNHIIDLTQEVLKTDRDDTEDFAKSFSKDMNGLKKLFDFVYYNFEYSEDPNYNQWVQTPSYLWATKKGDCKSFTVFISSVLYNMGIDHIIRYVSYGRGPVTHVYPIALLNGQRIPMDVVYKVQKGGRFGQEKPYFNKKDFTVKGLYKLGHIGATSQKDLEASAKALESEFASIPDEIIDSGPGDVTKMTSGQLDRIIIGDRYDILSRQEENPRAAQQYRDAAQALKKGSIAGIGSLRNDRFGREVQKVLLKTANDQKPAFDPFRLSIPTPNISGGLKGLFRKIGGVFTKVWKKMVNWVFKGMGKKMAPFFLFLFAKKNKVKSKEVKRRIAVQEKTFNWIASTGRMDKVKLMGVMANGIKEQTKYTPNEIINRSAGREITGIIPGIITFVIKAIAFVVKVVSKITKLFGKPSPGGISQSNMSDISLLEGENIPDKAPTKEASKPGASNPQSKNSSTNSGLGIAAGLAALAFALT